MHWYTFLKLETLVRIAIHCKSGSELRQRFLKKAFKQLAVFLDFSLRNTATAFFQKTAAYRKSKST